MNGNFFNSQGVHVATVIGSSIFGLRGQNFPRAPKFTNFLESWLGTSRMRKLPNSIWTERPTGYFLLLDQPPPALQRDRLRAVFLFVKFPN